MLIRRHNQRAFTLIELLIGISIVAILTTMALPNFKSWIQNLQIRNTTESILNGLQLARAEAVKSNLNVEFILTDASPADASNVGAAASVTGKNWIVRTFQSTGSYTAADFIQGRESIDGSKNATVATPQASFIFTPLARLVNPVADVNIDVNSSLAFANKRPMRVVVSTGGQIRMCDPNGPTGTSPQFC